MKLRFIKTFFEVVRSKLILWLLNRYTQPEFTRVLIRGCYKILEGDLVLIGDDGKPYDIGRVEDIPHSSIITIRVYRRPR